MIHPTALVSARAEIASDVSVGPFSIIHDDVRIGAGSVIGSHCEIGGGAHRAGEPLVIGRNALIRSHSVFYRGSVFGDNLVTGHHVTVREGLRAGTALQIGTLSDLQGDSVIGDHVRLHSNVHVGKHSTLGSFVWLFPYVVLTNDPHPPSEVMLGTVLHDYAVIATMCTILPGVTVGEGALVGAHSCVRKDVRPGTLVSGVPAAFVCEASRIRLSDGSGRPAYPWPAHFRRGYPDEVVAEWIGWFGAGATSVLPGEPD